MRAPRLPVAVLPKTLLAKSHAARSLRVSPALIECAALDVPAVYARMQSRPRGLTAAEAAARLAAHGLNVLARDQRPAR